MASCPYPRLERLIRVLALDNGMTMREEPYWPASSDSFERMTIKLNPDGVDNSARYAEGPYENEYELLACGEASDQEILLRTKPDLKLLSVFLDEVFDGKFSSIFFEGEIL